MASTIRNFVARRTSPSERAMVEKPKLKRIEGALRFVRLKPADEKLSRELSEDTVDMYLSDYNEYESDIESTTECDEEFPPEEPRAHLAPVMLVERAASGGSRRQSRRARRRAADLEADFPDNDSVELLREQGNVPIRDESQMSPDVSGCTIEFVPLKL